jgi:hypothetical protein
MLIIRGTQTVQPFDKSALRDKLLSLEAASAEETQRQFDTFLRGARLDQEGTVDSGDVSLSSQNASFANQWDQQLDEHEAHRTLLQQIDFGAKTEVVPGALVKINQRYLVVAVPTTSFEFNGVEVLGISLAAPLAKAMAGMSEGDTVKFNGKAMVIEQVS